MTLRLLEEGLGGGEEFGAVKIDVSLALYFPESEFHSPFRGPGDIFPRLIDLRNIAQEENRCFRPIGEGIWRSGVVNQETSTEDEGALKLTWMFLQEPQGNRSPHGFADKEYVPWASESLAEMLEEAKNVFDGVADDQSVPAVAAGGKKPTVLEERVKRLSRLIEVGGRRQMLEDQSVVEDEEISVPILRFHDIEEYAVQISGDFFVLCLG